MFPVNFPVIGILWKFRELFLIELSSDRQRSQSQRRTPIVKYYREEAERRKAEQQRTEPDPPPRFTREWHYRTHGSR